MISVRLATRHVDEHVHVICTDGQIVEGFLESVDDEEESGLGEPGISLTTSYGSFVGIPLNEIRSITAL